jgi:hypothetical protein
MAFEVWVLLAAMHCHVHTIGDNVFSRQVYCSACAFENNVMESDAHFNICYSYKDVARHDRLDDLIANPKVFMSLDLFHISLYYSLNSKWIFTYRHKITYNEKVKTCFFLLFFYSSSFVKLVVDYC